MIKVPVNETLTTSLIKRLFLKYNTNDLCIVLKNTKMQSSDNLYQIAQAYPRVVISVTGGLDSRKNKFDNEYYQRRTYYSAMELSKIVEIYRNIERKINISWTDTQKVMFVYQELCNCMEYSKNVINNRDVARNLMGLLYGKAVCSGFAMIFKEALDRLGITNIYQNRESSHSWNIAYVDGAYRAFELTWDCSNKSNRGCEFYYFNRDDHFYENKHHNIEFESEEKQYPITRYSDEEIRYNYQVINQPRVIRYPIIDNKPINITIKKQSYSFILDNGKLRVLGNNTKEFTRDDGTNFVLINGGAYKNLNKYFYVEVKDNIVRMARIYSESRLDKQDDSYDYIIANGLLSQERLATKINQFNGYVGYIGNNQMIYYDEDFEKSELNIIR